jgi:glycerol-3-phosphate dehydrogenase
MASTVDDILSRRTRARLQTRDISADAAAAVAALIGPELGWDEAEQNRQVADYRARIDEELAAISL